MYNHCLQSLCQPALRHMPVYPCRSVGVRHRHSANGPGHQSHRRERYGEHVCSTGLRLPESTRHHSKERTP